MATIIVQRPKLAWHERWFISTLLKGLKITVGHGIKTFLQIAGSKPKVTMEYPEQKWDEHLPEHYRGAPALVTDEQDRERCVSCQLCEFICPPKAIKIIPSEIPSDYPWAKVAIFLRKDYAITGLSRQEMVHNKKRLYEIGGQRVGLVNKWNELK